MPTDGGLGTALHRPSRRKGFARDRPHRLHMSDQSIADLDAQIAAFDAAVRHIKFNRRAMLAGRASGAVRKHSPQALDLRARYEADGGGYGRVRQLARETGLSERQAHRILRDLKPG